MPPICPSIQLLGNGFGQNGSTRNCGTPSAPADTVAIRSTAASAAAQRTGIMSFPSSNALRVLRPNRAGLAWNVDYADKRDGGSRPIRCGAAGVESLLRELLANRLQFAPARGVRFWIGHLQAFHGVDNNPGYDQPGVFLVVGGNDVPRSVPGAGRADTLLIGFHVLLPESALLDIRGAEFPVLCRVIDAFEKSLALFILRQVEEEFHDSGAIGVEVPFQIVDGTIAVVPDGVLAVGRVRESFTVQDVGMYAHDQHLFVVRPVENADPPALRQVAGRAPEKVMLQFVGARMLVAEYLAALRIDPGHDVLDDAVFARGVHGLKI